MRAAVDAVYLVLTGLVLLAEFGLSLVVCTYGCVIAGMLARRKGHTVVSVGVMTTIGGLVSMAAFIAALAIGSTALPPSQSLALVFATPTVAPAIVLLIAWALPRRTVRIFGRRRGGRWLIVAGRSIGLTLGVTATIVVLIVVWGEIESWSDAAVVAVLAALASLLGVVPWYIMTRMGRNAERQPALEDVLAHDPRPLVLFLRPFASERQPFVMGEYERYAPFFRGYGRPQKGVTVYIPLEAYLAESLRRLIGPFVALGSPEDFTHPVSGAVRKYATDETWQQEFDELAASAAVILVEAGNSASLRWEFAHVLQRGWQDRLILITSHPTHFSHSARFWRRLQRLVGVATPTWTEFAATLRSAGYDVPADDPGPGSIVAFDPQARAVVLTTGADLPADYVDAIQQHVATRTRVREAIKTAGYVV